MGKPIIRDIEKCPLYYVPILEGPLLAVLLCTFESVHDGVHDGVVRIFVGLSVSREVSLIYVINCVEQFFSLPGV